MSALVRIPVGVVIERRKATSPWIDFVWRPLAVLHGEPAAAPWTKLSEDAEAATFYAGSAEVELHRGDTGSYRENLATGAPGLWVVLRPTGVEPPYDVVRVTADPSEGEAYSSTGDDIVEQLPMPDAIAERLEAFVAEHHVERPFYKRKRNRADPEALGKRAVVREDDE